MTRVATAAFSLALAATFGFGWHCGARGAESRAKPPAARAESRGQERPARSVQGSDEHRHLARYETLLGDFGDACLSTLGVPRADDRATCARQVEVLEQRAESAVEREFLSQARAALDAHEAPAVEPVKTAAGRDYAASVRARYEENEHE